MHYDLNNYFPDHHYHKAIRQQLQNHPDIDTPDFLPDGGRPRKNYYMWLTKDNTVLYLDDINGEEADVLYETMGEAEKALEQHLDRNPDNEERYRAANLYRFKIKNQALEGVEVLTEQQGLFDFD